MSHQPRREELHAFVHGRVQGVFFRQTTESQAHRLGLRGWVRNLPDGNTVEVLAQGARQELEELLSFLHHGPPGANVEQVKAEWRDANVRLGRFRTAL
ncbi:MAG: acylphosphatase [Dehalococcoidia bacterium]